MSMSEAEACRVLEYSPGEEGLQEEGLKAAYRTMARRQVHIRHEQAHELKDCQHAWVAAEAGCEGKRAQGCLPHHGSQAGPHQTLQYT